MTRHAFSAPVALIKRARGFTLVELMIAVVVVAILATIAVPSYRQYVLRANRTVAKATAADLISRQEGYNLDHKRYATSLSKFGYPSGTLYLDREGNLSGTNGDDAIYAVTLQGNPGSSNCPPEGSASRVGFTIVMAPVGGQTADTHWASLCQSSAGLRGASGGGSDCWKR